MIAKGMALDASHMAIIGKLKDLLVGTHPETDPFLYYLPRLLEYSILQPVGFESYLSFAQSAVSIQKPQLVQDALTILNQLINKDDGSLIPPSPAMFENNSNFRWGELGGHTDPNSTILHIVNKSSLVLNLGK